MQIVSLVLMFLQKKVALYQCWFYNVVFEFGPHGHNTQCTQLSVYHVSGGLVKMHHSLICISWKSHYALC